MEIILKEITIRELTQGYQNNKDSGVVAFHGKLDVRPPYQREFIYSPKQRDAVIDTISKNFPLNLMYWAVREDKSYEIIDGQQRTISICEYVSGEFSFQNLYFHNLLPHQKDEFLDYRLMIYFCSGSDSEKLEWFKTINIAGEELTEQELRNAVYSGSWVTDAKKYFSKNNCAAYGLGKNYLNGILKRQDYLETAIKWLSDGKIELYMAKNQHQPNAIELWNYFSSVMNWVKAIFPNYRKQMKGVNWGALYNEFSDSSHDHNQLEKEIANLILDDDVTNKSGIYPYLLTRNKKYLSIRAFTDSIKQKIYEQQEGICVKCKKKFHISEMEADHITPWHEGGKTTQENCQMLCKDDNRKKSGA